MMTSEKMLTEHPSILYSLVPELGHRGAGAYPSNTG